jgi:hypothetical protein
VQSLKQKREKLKNYTSKNKTDKLQRANSDDVLVQWDDGKQNIVSRSDIEPYEKVMFCRLDAK